MKKDDEPINLTPQETRQAQELKAKEWTELNREAIESSNRYVEEHGLPLEKVSWLYWHAGGDRRGGCYDSCHSRHSGHLLHPKKPPLTHLILAAYTSGRGC